MPNAKQRPVLNKAEILGVILDNCDIVKDKLFRITQQVDKAQKILREIEDELYEFREASKPGQR